MCLTWIVKDQEKKARGASVLSTDANQDDVVVLSETPAVPKAITPIIGKCHYVDDYDNERTIDCVCTYEFQVLPPTDDPTASLAVLLPT